MEITNRRVFCDPAHGNPAIGSILVQASAQEGPMRTEVDFMRLTPYQREVLTALVRQLSKNEVVRLLQIVEATIPSAGVLSEATKQAILNRAKAVIEELERERTA
jgi:DNA-binding NarL/FixJ family response regulator